MDIFSKISAYLTNCQFWSGVITAAILIIVAEVLVWGICRLRRKVKAITIKDAGGDFSISRKAFREFLKGVVAVIPSVSLKDVELKRGAQDKVKVNLFLNVQGNADLVAAHNILRNQLLLEAQSKLGIADRIDSVNIICVNLPSSSDLKAAAAPATTAEEAPNANAEASENA